MDYYLFKNTKDVNLPEIRLEKGENAENGLHNAFSKKEARLKCSMTKLNNEILEIRTKLIENWNNTWVVYCDGTDVLKQFSNKYGGYKSFGDIRDMVSIVWDTTRVLPKDLDDIITKITSS